MAEIEQYPETDVDGLDPQEVLEQDGDADTDVDHEPNPDADAPGDDPFEGLDADADEQVDADGEQVQA